VQPTRSPRGVHPPTNARHFRNRSFGKLGKEDGSSSQGSDSNFLLLLRPAYTLHLQRLVSTEKSIQPANHSGMGANIIRAGINRRRAAAARIGSGRICPRTNTRPQPSLSLKVAALVEGIGSCTAGIWLPPKIRLADHNFSARESRSPVATATGSCGTLSPWRVKWRNPSLERWR
jgi:hypothetical protein